MSRLARIDRAAYRDWVVAEDFSGIIHVAGDDVLLGFDVQHGSATAG